MWHRIYLCKPGTDVEVPPLPLPVGHYENSFQPTEVLCCSTYHEVLEHQYSPVALWMALYKIVWGTQKWVPRFYEVTWDARTLENLWSWVSSGTEWLNCVAVTFFLSPSYRVAPVGKGLGVTDSWTRSQQVRPAVNNNQTPSQPRMQESGHIHSWEPELWRWFPPQRIRVTFRQWAGCPSFQRCRLTRRIWPKFSQRVVSGDGPGPSWESQINYQTQTYNWFGLFIKWDLKYHHLEF